MDVIRRSYSMKEDEQMKNLIPALTLLAMLGSATIASAETTSLTLQVPATPGNYLIVISSDTGKLLGDYTAMLAPSSPTLSLTPAPQIKHAFDDVTPLTIEQQNAAAERVLESQGPPLHTN
jgi:hypothetical protein